MAYGDLHQRYKMCTPDCSNPTSTTYYLYDPVTGGMSEKVVSGSSTTWNDYIIADGQIVAVRTKSGTTTNWKYVVGDHLGSVTSVNGCGLPGCVVEHDSAACPLARERAARGMPGASAATPMHRTIPAAPSQACSAAASPSTRCWIPSAS